MTEKETKRVQQGQQGQQESTKEYRNANDFSEQRSNANEHVTSRQPDTENQTRKSNKN